MVLPAEPILEDLERRRNHGYLDCVSLANAALGLGDHDRAISWLQQAAEERDRHMIHLGAHFAYDALRTDYIALGFSWTLDCERVLAGGVSR